MIRPEHIKFESVVQSSARSITGVGENSAEVS